MNNRIDFKKHLAGIRELTGFAYSVTITFTFSKYGIYNVVIIIISLYMHTEPSVVLLLGPRPMPCAWLRY